MSAVIGAGVIEIAWTALMLAHGDDRSYRMKMATIEAIPYSLPTVRPSQAMATITEHTLVLVRVHDDEGREARDTGMPSDA
jgi:hypothetical protein